jgi:hypothetical protein
MLGPVTNERRRRRVRVYENRAQRAVSIYLPGCAKHKKSTQGSIGEFFLFIFFNHFAKLSDCFEIYQI